MNALLEESVCSFSCLPFLGVLLCGDRVLHANSQWFKHFPLTPMTITVAVNRASEQRPPGDDGD